MIKNKLLDQFIALGNQLAEESNAAHDLWTWLPSCKVTQKHHGNYVDEFTPSATDIMIEAAMHLGVVSSTEKIPPTIDERSWFERCACGESHLEENK